MGLERRGPVADHAGPVGTRVIHHPVKSGQKGWIVPRLRVPAASEFPIVPGVSSHREQTLYSLLSAFFRILLRCCRS